MTFTDGNWVYDNTTTNRADYDDDTAARTFKPIVKKPDMVNSPAHYKQGDDGIECIDAIKA